MYKRLWDIILVFVWTWGVSKNWLKINSITEAVKFLVITAWVLHHYKGILFILANRYWVKDPAKRLGLPLIKDWIKKYIFISPFNSQLVKHCRAWIKCISSHGSATLLNDWSTWKNCTPTLFFPLYKKRSVYVYLGIAPGVGGCKGLPVWFGANFLRVIFWTLSGSKHFVSVCMQPKSSIWTCK